MDLEILKDAQNPLFNRKEVFAKVNANSVPSKDEVAKALAEKYKVEVNALRVLDVRGNFGVREFLVRANVYPTNAERDNIEKLTKKEKESEAKAAEEAAKPAEPEVVEEAPSEAPAEPEKAPTEEAKEVEPEKAEEEKKEENKTEEEKQTE